MQKRRTLLAAAVLMLALALFFGTLPLYAAGMQTNSTTAGGNDSLSGAVGGALDNAADAVKGAAEDIFGSPAAGRRDAAGAADNGNNAGDNNVPGDVSGSNPGDVPADNGSLNPDAGNNGMAGDGTAGDNNTAGDMLPGDGAGGNGENGILPDGNTADTPTGDDLLPGETAGDGATLGDVNGDGMTDDRAPETTGTEDGNTSSGFSWGGILLAILTAVAVVVVVVLLLPRKSKR